MRVQGLQHVPFDDIGAMAPWLAARGVIPDYNRFYEDGLLPPVDALDLVIVMGGPVSVNDEAQLPWLRAEKRFLREAIGHGIRVLGVSLGAQPIANVLGARVYPNAEKEIGWFPIQVVRADADTHEDCCRFPAESLVFHRYGETLRSAARCRALGAQRGLRESGVSDRPADGRASVPPGNHGGGAPRRSSITAGTSWCPRLGFRPRRRFAGSMQPSTPRPIG
jgi:GMP synthase-like glutamine amidotransferase